ncbi:YhcN/YlaJ family sporulation lipoprotein [Bacillus sp. FJAT-29790]|uniref:YhcN/YlaJ family sporulation lipoprotein n=1 Tax=Bacillus sp. FJAT-29790 TaxID=1895002 RepID=UPI001C243605|nr:YhcN/YlaJ family sporulation lipoprotein [Bacillus sp. FJAT-29790]
MKKSLIIIGICGLTALTACQSNIARDGIYEKSGNTINVNTQRADIYNKDRGLNNKNANFGYVRHQKSPILGENVAYNHYAAIDREQIADIISKYCTEIPNVHDVSTLVTDKEVLIIYDTDTANSNRTADQVKRMAMSVVPRWYHVYVSDNTNLRKNVESYATLDSNSRNAHFGINKLIKDMQKSPQGYKMGEGENANGEMPWETKNAGNRK